MNPNSTAAWRVPMAVQIAPAGVLFIGGFFLHESPLWLMRKNREEEATQALESLRQIPRDHKYLQEDLDMIRKRLADESRVASRFGTGPWALFRGAISELTKKGMRNRVLLVFCSFALQNMSGAAGKFSIFLSLMWRC